MRARRRGGRQDRSTRMGRAGITQRRYANPEERAEEEREETHADARAVDVGLGHQYRFVIAQAFNVECLPNNPTAPGGGDRVHHSRQKPRKG